ncbi:hypothetical protein [Catenovulum adriaticum]|uniref:Lipoprotein n=1 Tax=Catenovulum adriaticum TaxID=2984846 RepID=A0ABY7AM36_9ALTE|nr:hypothetical protein [Catenovulum sp. TS8]WAJ69520.1 hypothetical protein OLW01_10090 [Catenovulum sp. TS8]
MKSSLLFIVSVLTLSACDSANHSQTLTKKESQQVVDNETTAIEQQRLAYTRNKVMHNDAAYVPPQCYTKTVDELGETQNPCYACHDNGKKPNYISGVDLQLEYGFTAAYLQTNRWSNLFKDFSKEVAEISNDEIKQYIRQSNYFSDDGSLTLANKLKNVPPGWDVNKDGQWNGFIPDAYFNFDQQGFDLKPNGEFSGWRAFAYSPFVGAFFPANGATDDVLIRLPSVFQQDEQGQFNLDIYKVNLAIVEAMIKRQSVEITPIDENLFGVDIDKNGELSMAIEVKFDWAPLDDRLMSYVGQAKQALAKKQLHIAGGLYPEGTEFLHTLRYLDWQDEALVLSKRIKEVRYSKKTGWNTYPQLQNAALSEIKEKNDFPERLRQFTGDGEVGLYTGFGWVLQGFIEDKVGDLRPQTYEETVFCMGCHSGISATTDGAFAFSRKLDASTFKQGWYHWSEKGLAGLMEPKLADGRNEYATYLANNIWGDEFRSNSEIKAKFLTETGELNKAALAKLNKNIGELLIPTKARANKLNKAYRAIVKEESYIYGRQPFEGNINHVHDFVESGTPTQVELVLK